MSGPLLDRVDLQVWLLPVTPADLLDGLTAAEPTAAVAARVAAARAAAAARLAGTGWRINAEVPGPELRTRWRLPVSLSAPADAALDRGELSARGYDRVLRIAWSIADLAGQARPSRDRRRRGRPPAKPLDRGMSRPLAAGGAARPGLADARRRAGSRRRATTFVGAVGPAEAARRLRAGEAPGRVAALAEARRRDDRAASDLAEAERLGARLVTPEDDEWPDDALRAMEIAFARERGQPPDPRDEERLHLAPPLALWVIGRSRVDEAFARSVAVVGLPHRDAVRAARRR